METLGVAMATGEPDQVIILPGPSYLPILNAASLGVFFVCFLLGLYWYALVGLGLTLVVTLFWLWSNGLDHDPQPQAIGYGETAIAHPASPEAPGWWGMVFTLVADGVLFSSLAFGLLFLWVAAPDWPPSLMQQPDWLLAGLAGLGLAAAALASRAASRVPGGLMLGLSALASLVAVAVLAWLALALGHSATSHAQAAATTALVVYALIHALIGLAGAGFVMARHRAGFVSPLRNLEPRVLWLWQGYTAATGLIALAMVTGLPSAMTG